MASIFFRQPGYAHHFFLGLKRNQANALVQVVFVPEINVWQAIKKIQLTAKDLQVVNAQRGRRSGMPDSLAQIKMKIEQ